MTTTIWGTQYTQPRGATAWATSENNTIDASASTNFLPIVGADFAGAGAIIPGYWALTAAGCVLVWNGGQNDFLIDLTVTLKRTAVSAVLLQTYVGIARNEDLLGGNPAALFESVERLDQAASLSDLAVKMSTQRIVRLAAGETVQPVFAQQAAAVAADLGILRLNISVTGPFAR